MIGLASKLVAMAVSESQCSLKVFVTSVEDTTAGAQRSSPEVTIACRFLDYPTFFINPSRRAQAANSVKKAVFQNGKSCVLAEEGDQLRGLIAEVRSWSIIKAAW